MKSTNSLLSLVPTKVNSDLRKVHLKLNQYYYALIFGNARQNLLTESCLQELKKQEAIWITHDKRECLKKYHCDRQIKNAFIVEIALKDHPVVNHPLFDYLSEEATSQELKTFIRNESILNFEFFDYLALALVGASDFAKAEISANLWDEAGRGVLDQFHTRLFGKLFKDLNLSYERQAIARDLPWEALSGINLFSYCAIYSYNKMIYYGLLAATEMLDPPHYTKLIRGLRRVFSKQAIDYSYYLEHERIDVEHANGWLRKVVLPELETDPQKTRDFWLGFYLRLDSVKRYYDRLLQLLTLKMAA